MLGRCLDVAIPHVVTNKFAEGERLPLFTLCVFAYFSLGVNKKRHFAVRH